MRWPAPCASTASAACAIVAPKPSSIAPAGSRWSPRPSCCGTPSISAAPWTRCVGTVSQCRKQSLPISRPWAGATSISPAITSGPATANLTPTVSGLSGAALQPWPPWQPPDVPALSAWSESVPVLSGDPEYPLVGIEGFVGNERLGLKRGQQGIGSGQIVLLTAGEMKAGRIAERIHQGVDLGGQPALAAADGLIIAQFLGAPAAC